MSPYEVLSAYTTGAAAKVCALALLVFALRLVIVPFVLITVLLVRAQRRLSTVVASIPATAASHRHPHFSRAGEPA